MASISSRNSPRISPRNSTPATRAPPRPWNMRLRDLITPGKQLPFHEPTLRRLILDGTIPEDRSEDMADLKTWGVNEVLRAGEVTLLAELLDKLSVDEIFCGNNLDLDVLMQVGLSKLKVLKVNLLTRDTTLDAKKLEIVLGKCTALTALALTSVQLTAPETPCDPSTSAAWLATLAASTLRQNPNISHLQINSCQLDLTLELADACLGTDSGLVQLNLNDNNSESGLANLAPFLAKNTKLRILNLGGSTLNANTVHLLGGALAHNTILESLDMSSSLAPGEAGKVDWSWLMSNSGLKKLSLDDNGMNGEGIKALAETLAKSPSLQSVFLFDNDWNDDSVNSLCSILSGNTTLRRLRLGATTRFSDSAMSMMLMVLRQKNRTLEECDFGMLDADSLRELSNVLERNQQARLGNPRHRGL